MPTLTDNEMRLECLKLAMETRGVNPSEVVPLAREFYVFATDDPLDDFFDKTREHITAQEIGDEAVN